MKNTHFLLAAIMVIATGGTAGAEPKAYKVDMAIYRALTNVSGDTSCTHDSSSGVWHKGRLMLNDIKLEVDGPGLVWTLPDGSQMEELKDQPLIQLLSRPSVVALAGEPVQLTIGEEIKALQYFEARTNGLYALMQLQADFLGFKYSGVVKDDGLAGLLKLEFTFDNAWVEEREKIEGVELEVGKPKITRQKAEGYLTAAPGDWSVYQIHVPSRGMLFIFFKITPASETPAAAAKEADTPGGKASAAGSGSEPSVTIGGEIRTRVGYGDRPGGKPSMTVGGSLRTRIEYGGK